MAYFFTSFFAEYVHKTPRFRMVDFSIGHPRGFGHGFWHFAKKFLEKGVFFFASFLLDEQKKPIGSRTHIYGIKTVS